MSLAKYRPSDRTAQISGIKGFANMLLAFPDFLPSMSFSASPFHHMCSNCTNKQKIGTTHEIPSQRQKTVSEA
jgi:hypothetical protein